MKRVTDIEMTRLVDGGAGNRPHLTPGPEFFTSNAASLRNLGWRDKVWHRARAVGMAEDEVVYCLQLRPLGLESSHEAGLGNYKGAVNIKHSDLPREEQYLRLLLL